MRSEKVQLLDVNIDNVGVKEVLVFIEETVRKQDRAIISYVNIYALNLCFEHEWFRNFINACHLVFCDGYGVNLGARLIGKKLNYRFTPPDWIELVCEYAVKHSIPMYFLGAQPGVSALAAETLIKKFPGLQIHTHHGYFDHFGAENDQVLAHIRESGANIILVGMGMPLQEKWIRNNFQELPDANIFLPVGAMFDYISELLPRGPRWLTDNGFEWLTRLVIEPRRLWRRYLIGNPHFFIRILLHRLGLIQPKTDA
jgi:N-acetylglucosaminyldiphosphoundecaprenol N-acetyl-beta-D-mannosaminyltransferase